jgi:hypothetical protein
VRSYILCIQKINTWQQRNCRCYSYLIARFEVFSAVWIWIVVFRDVMACRVVISCRCFGWACCLQVGCYFVPEEVGSEPFRNVFNLHGVTSEWTWIILPYFKFEKFLFVSSPTPCTLLGILGVEIWKLRAARSHRPLSYIVRYDPVSGNYR